MGVSDSARVAFPEANYLVLATRLVPGLDGGAAIATVARARQMAEFGVHGGAGPLLLTVDPGTSAEHAAHRQTLHDRGDGVVARRMRNLFDEAADPNGGAAPWLRQAAQLGSGAGRSASGVSYRTITDAYDRPVLNLPVVSGDPHWHASTADIRVYDADAEVIGVLAGFGALYRAWLQHVVAQLRAAAGSARHTVAVCESRQFGELLVPWTDPDVRVLQAVHNTHLDAPYTVDAPLNPLTERWLPFAEFMDAVLWLTPAQRDDVVRRFGTRARHLVCPNGVRPPASVVAREQRAPDRAVMLARLAPVKRIEHAIRAYAAVLHRIPEATLDIHGDGAEREYLQGVITELGLDAAVTLRGVTDDPGAVLDQASVMLCTSMYEGQPLALIEALGRGCPVVSYDVRYGPADLLTAGGGILVPDGDQLALAAAIVQVLSHPDVWTHLSETAVTSARQADPAAAMSALAAAATTALATPSRRSV